MRGWKLWLLMGVVVILVSGYACSGVAAQVTVHMAIHAMDPGGMFAEAEKRFNQEHPNIKLEMIKMPSAADQNHDKQMMFLSSKSPQLDIVNVDVIWPPEFGGAGWLVALDERFAPEEQAKFPPAQIKSDTWEGHIYAVPWMLDSHVLWYRKDLLKKYGFEVPDTWMDLVEVSRTIIAAEGIDGYVTSWGRGEQLSCNYIEFLKSKGGEFFDENGNVVINSKEGVEALQFMIDLIYKYRVSPKALITYIEVEPPRRTFTEGKAVSHSNWSYVWSVSQAEGSKVVGKVGMAPMPRFAGGQHACAVGGWNWAISKWSRHPEEAWKVIEWFSSVEIQKWMMLGGSFMFSRMELSRDPEILKMYPFLAEYQDIYNAGVVRPRTPYYSQISDVEQGLFNDALAGEITAKEALDSLAAEIRKIMGK